MVFRSNLLLYYDAFGNGAQDISLCKVPHFRRHHDLRDTDRDYLLRLVAIIREWLE